MLTKFSAGYLLCVALAAPAVLRAADAKSDKAAAAPAASTAATSNTAAANAATSNTAASTTDANADNSKVKGRLPTGWGKLGITDVQKQAIYKVEATYDAQLDSLRKQVTDLEAKRAADMRNVLTAAQQKQLDDMATAKSTKKAAAAEAKSAAPASAASSTPKTSMNEAKTGAAASSASTNVNVAGTGATK
jgi:Spy/CpxP family protein refolding chaperone